MGYHNRSLILKQGNKALYIFTGIVALIYLANCFTHLRLTNDTLRYFTLTETLAGIRPPDTATQKEFLPYGYVIFLLTLYKLNILASFSICICQLAFLAGSLYFVRYLFPTVKAMPLILFMLLNWSTLRFVITPLSEMQFLFFSTGALYFFRRYELNGSLKFLGLLIVFSVISIFTRTAGVVLLIAFIPALIVKHYKPLTYWFRQKTIYALLVLIILVAGTAYFLMQPKFIAYLEYFFRPLLHDSVEFFTRNIRHHLADWAELFVNIPASKTGSFVPLPTGVILFMIAGIFFLVFILFRLFSRQLGLPLFLKIYIITYGLLVFNWPFFEARFWFPILPLLGGIALMPLAKESIIFQRFVSIYKYYYILAGIFVLGYYSYLSYDKNALARLHDAGIWRNEYELHFYKDSYESKPVNEKAMHILNTYD
jgi:hypothetical protein